MEKVTIERLKLLEIVQANRAKHKEIVDESLTEYRKQAIAELDRAIEAARSGKKIWRVLSLVESQDHTRDYDRAIRSLELEINPNVEVSDEYFKCLVMDDWSWKAQFSASNRFYTDKV